jgi:hypothetical protein
MEYQRCICIVGAGAPDDEVLSWREVLKMCRGAYMEVKKWCR